MKKARKLQYCHELLVGGSLGALIGLLLGLSISSVVGTIIGALVALLGAFLGLTQFPNISFRHRRLLSFRMMGFALAGLLFSCIGLY